MSGYIRGYDTGSEPLPSSPITNHEFVPAKVMHKRWPARTKVSHNGNVGSIWGYALESTGVLTHYVYVDFGHVMRLVPVAELRKV